MEQVAVRPTVRIEFIAALIAVVVALTGFLALPRFTRDLMLNVIRQRAKVQIDFDNRQTRGFFWVRYQNLSVQRGAGVKVTVRDAVVEYNVLDLIFKRLDLKLTGQGVQIHVASNKSLTNKS